MTDMLSTLLRKTDGEITIWSPAMELRYGFGSDQAVGQIANHLLKTIFLQSEDDIRTSLVETHRWSGGLIHYHANGKPILTAVFWIMLPAFDGRAECILESHCDIFAPGCVAHQVLMKLLVDIHSELIGSLTAISIYNAAARFPGLSSDPVPERVRAGSIFASHQIGRNSKAVHRLREIVDALRVVAPNGSS